VKAVDEFPSLDDLDDPLDEEIVKRAEEGKAEEGWVRDTKEYLPSPPSDYNI